jgi:hypothetical protein
VRGAVDVCRSHHVAPDTVIKVAAAHAEFADSSTGRDCRPTNERLVEVAQCSLSTVQRARRVLIELGLMVEVVAGRSSMTRAQRLVAYENGSSHRAIAAEFALCSLRERRPRLVDNRPPAAAPVDRDTPPVGQVVREESLERRWSLQRQNRTSDEEAAPRPAPKGIERRRAGGDPAARALAEGVRKRLPWLRAVSARRLTPALTRFARADWTAYDVERGLADQRAARGARGVPRDLQVPAAYFAKLLRQLDPADRPTADDDAYEAHLRAQEAAEATYDRLRRSGAPCPHGVSAGDVPSPSRGIRACPHCRAARA